MENNQISFKDALKILDIQEYEERIFNSNSHGELYHLQDYIDVANFLKGSPTAVQIFKKHFEECVEDAYKNWQRPQSVFQHIKKFF